ncbi:MAG: hypothetical protein Kow0068_21540 [Marinilabiliales bacterium]
MSKSKILIVEDDKLLSTTYTMFVEDLGHEVIAVCASGEEAITEVKNNVPDLILMDIYLDGQFDGIATAAKINEFAFVPVIYITSDEEFSTISRALENNSYGYLIKPVNKVSLAITIEQTLLKIKHERELNLREQRYRTLIEDSPDAIVVVDEDHKIKFINFTGLKLFGTIHIEDILNKKLEEFFKSEQAEILFSRLSKAFINKEKIDYFPLDFIALNNREFLVGIVGSVIEFNNAPAIQLVITDHTQRIKSEIELKSHIDIINKIEDGIIVLDRNGKITNWNTGAENIFKFKSNEVIYNSINELFKDQPDFYKKRILKPVLKKEKHFFVEKYQNPDKNISTDISFQVYPIFTESDLSGIVCVCSLDIKKIEYEILLENINNNFLAVLKGSTEGIILIDKDYTVAEYNTVAQQYAETKIRKELKTGISILDFLYFFNRNELIELFKNSLEGVSHYLERYIKVDDDINFFKINILPVIGAEGSVSRIIIFILDITKPKQLEKEIIEIQSDLKPMFDSSIQRFYLTDLNYKLLSFNKAAKDTIQKEFNRILKKGDNVIDFIPESMTPDEFKGLFERAKKGEHVVFKQEVIHEDEVEYDEAHIEPIINDKGEIYRILIWTMDVTESERNIQALKESEERYALVAKGGNDGIWDWDMIKDEVYLSPRWKAVLGYDEDEHITREDARDLMIHPDDIEKTKENLVKHLNGETEIYINEYRLKHKDGHFVWILERGLALRDENGKPYRMAGTITDITERKKHEAEIKAANDALMEERSMFMIGKVVVFRVDANNTSKVNYITENVKDVLGYQADEFINGVVDFQSIVHKEDKEIHTAEREKALKEKQSHVEFSVYRVYDKFGKIHYLKDFIKIIYNKQNEPVELLGYFIDVTKEKDAETVIRENQQKYFTMFSEANDAILVIKDNKIVDFNDKALELFEYTKQEFTEINVLNLSPENQPSGTPSAEKWQRKVQDLFNNRKRLFYWKYITKNNKLLDAEVSLSLIEYSDQEYIHAIVRDITERKKIENELAYTKEKYINLFEALPDIIFILDKNGKYLDYKPDKYSNLIIHRDDVIGKTLDDFFIDEKKYEFKQKITNVLENNSLEIIKYALDTNIGRRNFEARISKLNTNEVLVLVRDNTDII